MLYQNRCGYAFLGVHVEKRIGGTSGMKKVVKFGGSSLASAVGAGEARIEGYEGHGHAL